MSMFLPQRLHRAVQIVSMSGASDAAEVQSACAQVAARIVLLEEALLELLDGAEGSHEKARKLVVQSGWWYPPTN